MAFEETGVLLLYYISNCIPLCIYSLSLIPNTYNTLLYEIIHLRDQAQRIYTVNPFITSSLTLKTTMYVPISTRSLASTRGIKRKPQIAPAKNI